MTALRWGSVEAPTAVPPPETASLLVFHLGHQAYAVPLGEVDAVVRAAEVRPVPQPRPFVIGVIERDGEPVPVVDLAAVLETDAPRAQHVLVHLGPHGPVAFLVDVAAGVARGVLRELGSHLQRAGGCLAALADVDGETAYVLDLGRAAPR